MKKTTLRLILPIVIVLLTISLAKAQDYKLFNSGQVYSFNSGPAYQINQQAFLNTYSWSTIKETRFDSIMSSSGDTLFYPFHTWRDTSDLNDTVYACGIKNGPSWMGYSIHELTSGTTWLFNFDNDSIRIDQLASFGQSWTMMSLAGGGSISATVDSLFITTVAGITDSVKQIKLTALDSVGGINALHALHQKTIWISKSNGLFRALSFRELPQHAQLNRIAPIPMATFGDIYNFDIGDEFEYYNFCSDAFGHFTPPGYTYYKIISKWNNLAMDSVFYEREVRTKTFQPNPTPPPLYNEVFTYTTDTVSYTNLSTPLYTEVPEQNTIQHLIPYNYFGVYFFGSDTAQFFGRPVYGEIGGFYDVIDSCIQFNNFEPIFYHEKIATGLGKTLSSSDFRSHGNNYCESSLIWYHKGSEIFGNYVSVITGIENPNNQNAVVIYPNPSRNQCSLMLDPKSYNSIELFSAKGEKLKVWNKPGTITVVDLSEFSAGAYFFSIKGPAGILVKKIIKLQD